QRPDDIPSLISQFMTSYHERTNDRPTLRTRPSAAARLRQPRDQLDNARAYANQHPEHCRVIADEQLTDPGVLVQACAALSAGPRGGQGSGPRPEAAAERIADLVLRAAARRR
ncbi:hypothetical protein ABZY23_33815, partial [Streptomyces sp. NPDC006638]